MKHERMHKVTMYDGYKHHVLEINAREAWQAIDIARETMGGLVVACRRVPVKRPRRHWRSHQKPAEEDK